MDSRLTVIFLAAVAVCAQTAPPITGSIGGVVQFQGTGALVDDGIVVIDPGNKKTKTDAQGRYSQHDLAPGTYHISVDSMKARASVSRAVTLLAGQDMTVDFHLPAPGSITGRIVDENKEPIPDVPVILFKREYSFGKLQYEFAVGAMANDQGEYTLSPVAPNRGYLVLAGIRAHPIDAISQAPADPQRRKRIPVPTYYSGADSPESAEVLTLRPGERREGVDIRMLRSPSYCAEGVLEGGAGPAKLNFWVNQQPANVHIAAGKTGLDGKIRVCDLHPGDYELTAFDSFESLSVYGNTNVSITDADVQGVRIAAPRRLTVPGEVVWDGKAPDKPVEAKIGLWLMPEGRGGYFKHEADGVFPKSAIPGHFSLPNLLMDTYNLRYWGVPDDLYIKDITYSGQSILHKPLNVGSAIGRATLRIVMATDGGVIAGKVTDKDGNPIPDAAVTVMPANAESEAILAAALDAELADQNGSWSTKRLAPGKYYVVASSTPFDMTPESIGRLWQLHNRAQEVELGPGATAQVTLTPLE